MLEGAGVEAKGDPKEKAHYFFKSVNCPQDDDYNHEGIADFCHGEWC